jgi:cytochrome c
MSPALKGGQQSWRITPVQVLPCDHESENCRPDIRHRQCENGETHLTIIKDESGEIQQRVLKEGEKPMRNRFLVTLSMLTLLAAASPGFAGDAAKGQKVFAKCKTCHEVASDKNKIGPHLRGLFGRTAGSVEGFAYSDAMKASGIVWSSETLEAYLADPKTVVPGTKMVFPGLKKDEEIENVIAYLEEATK